MHQLETPHSFRNYTFCTETIALTKVIVASLKASKNYSNNALGPNQIVMDTIMPFLHLNVKLTQNVRSHGSTGYSHSNDVTPF